MSLFLTLLPALSLSHQSPSPHGQRCSLYTRAPTCLVHSCRPSALLNDHCYVQGPPAPPPPLHSPPQPPTDKRVCLLCLQTGDLGNSVSSLKPAVWYGVCVHVQEAGRLLPCGCGEWVHINCAIWSAEVYEELSGVLRCVHAAISRGTRLVGWCVSCALSSLQRCDRCRELGATVGCCNSTCAANFHFMCARESGCVFLGSKEVFCHAHRHQGEGKVLWTSCANCLTSSHAHIGTLS